MARNYTKGARTVAAFQEAARRVFAIDGYLSAKVEDIAKDHVRPFTESARATGAAA